MDPITFVALLIAIAGIASLLVAVLWQYPRFKQIAELQEGEEIVYSESDVEVRYALYEFRNRTRARVELTTRRILEHYQDKFPTALVDYTGSTSPSFLWPMPGGTVLSIPKNSLSIGSDQHGEFLEVDHRYYGKRYYFRGMAHVASVLDL